MSSAHGEAEPGRASSASDEEEEEEIVNQPTEIEERPRSPIKTFKRVLANESNSDQNRNDEDVPAIESIASSSHSLNNDQKAVRESHGSALLSVGVDSPSSADGSLSIPDDTPSIRVCIVVESINQDRLIYLVGLAGIILR